MTEITDTEAAEVLWASSEPGKAAAMAACRRADELGLSRTVGQPPKVVEPADIGAIVYAAYLAAGWDAEPGEAEAGEPEPELEDEQVAVRAADLRALLDAVDTDYLSTENLPDLLERIDRLSAAAGLGDDVGHGGGRPERETGRA